MGSFKDYVSAMNAIKAGEKKLQTLQDELNSGKVHTFDELEGYSKTAERIASSYGKVKNIYEQLGSQFDDGGAVSYYNGIRDSINGQLEQRKTNFNTIFDTTAKGIISGDRDFVKSFTQSANRKFAVETINKAANGEYVSPKDIDLVTQYGKTLRGSAAFNDGGSSMQLVNAIEKLGETKGYYSLFRDEGDYIRRGKYAGKTYEELQAYLKELKADKSKNKAEITFLEAYITERKKTKHIDDAQIEMYKDPDFQQKVIEAVSSGIVNSGSKIEILSFDKNGKIIKPFEIEPIPFDKSIFNMTYEQAVKRIEEDPKLAQSILHSAGIFGKFLGASNSNSPLKKFSPYGVQVQAGLSSNYLTAEEVLLLAYTSKTKGAKEANLLMDELERTLGQRYAESEMLKMKKKYDNTDFWGAAGLNATTVLTSPFTALDALVDDVGDLITKGAIDPYNSASNIVQMQGEYIRTLTAEDIEKSTGSEGLRMLYNGAMSAADMLVWSPLLGPTAYSLTMGAKSFVSEARQLYNEGAEDWQVATLATVKASLEIATEKMGADKFLDMLMNSGESAGKKLISNILSEIVEEEASLLAGDAFDRVIRGKYSSYETNVRNYILNGLSEAEARERASKDFLNEAAETAITTLFSVVLSSGSVAAVKGTGNLLDKRANNKAIILQGYKILNNENVDELIETALSFDENTRAYKLAQKFNSDTSLKTNGKRVGYLYDAVIKQIEGQITQKAYTATQKRLEALGVDLQTAHNASRTIVDMAKFKKVDAKSKQAVLSNPVQKQVYFELTDSFNGDQTAEWVNAYYNSIQDLKVQRNLTAATARFTNEQYSQAKQQLNGGNNGGIIDNTQNTGVDSNGSTNTELLERGGVSAVSGSRNGIRQQSGNTQKLRSLLGTLVKTQGGSNSNLRAGESSWMGKQRKPESEAEGNNSTGLSKSFYRRLSQISAKNEDTVGRNISDENVKKLEKSIFKTEDGIIISLFHWTPFKFDEFLKGDIGFHLGTMQAAINHMEQSEDYNNDYFGYLKEVYCCASNPVFMQDFSGIWTPYDAVQLVEDGYITQEEYDLLKELEGFNDIENPRIDSEASIALRKMLANYGYDVILYKNTHEDAGSISAIVLNAEDIITVSENGVLKEGCGVTEIFSDTDTSSQASANVDLFDEQSAEFPKYDIVEDTVSRLAGKKRYTPEQKAMIEHGKAIGVKVDFEYMVETNEKGEKFFPDGRKNEDGSITINTKAKRPYEFLFKHEIVHLLELDYATYITFANKIMDSDLYRNWLEKKNSQSQSESGKNYRDMLNERYKVAYGNLSPAQFEEAINREMLADFVGENLFGKDNVFDIQRFIEMLEGDSRSAFKRFVDRIIAWFKEKFKPTDPVRKRITEFEKAFAKAWNASESARLKAAETQKTTADNSGGVKYYINDDFYNQLNKWDNETTGFSFVLGNTSEALKSAGIPDKQIRWDASKIKTLLNKHTGMTIDIVKQIPELLENPIVVIDSKQDSNSRIVMGDLYDEHNKIVTVVLLLSPTSKKGNVLDLIKVSSAEGRGHIQSLFRKEDGSSVEIRYKDEKRIQDWLNVNRLQLPLHSSNMDSNNKIPHNEDSVNNNSTQENKKYSLSKENPKTIAELTPEDANTTPPLERKKGDFKGDKESKLYGSLLGSDIFDDAFKEAIEDNDYIKTYSSVTNKETLKKAAKALDEGGMAYVLNLQNKNPDEASLIDITAGLILIDRYQRVGDYESAVAIAEKVRTFGTASGQQVQIFSILGRLDPNTMVAYAQKDLANAYEAMVKGKTKKWIDANKSRFELTDEEIDFIRRRTLQAALLEDGTRPKAILLAEICSLLQNKLPSEKGNAIRALQRISLLLNLKTNIRNITGNIGMVPVFIASDFFGSGIDRLVSKKTNVRTTGNFKLKGTKTALGKGLYESWDDFKRGIRTRQEELDRYDVNRGGGKNFNENHNKRLAKQLNAVSKVLNKIDNFTSFCLEAGDRPFFEMWMNNSLNNQMRLNNVDIPTPEMLEIAKEEALQRTWQDNNTFTNTVSAIKQKLNIVHLWRTSYGFGDFVLKFVKTPSNIAKAIVEFSPVGLTFAGAKFSQMKNAMETGQFTPQMQKQFVRSLSNAITGTLIYALVATGAALGVVKLSGAGDEDKDVSNFEKYVAGVPPYSIEIFGVNVTYDWMQPFGSVLATVADFTESRKENPEGSIFDDLWGALKVGGQTFTQQSFLSSMYELFSSDDLIEGITSAAISEPAAFIPQFFSQTASFLDDKQRVTYDHTSDFQTAINSVINKIPGLRTLLPERVNVLGETTENNQYLDPWNAFLSPGNTYSKSTGKVADGIYELYKQTGDKAVMPRVAPNYITVKGNKIVFSVEEKTNYQRRIGALSAEMLSVFMESKDYGKLSDEDKVSVVKKIYDYSAAKAKSELDYDYKVFSAMVGTKKNGDPIISKSKYNDMSEKAKRQLIEEYFLSKTERGFKDDAEKAVKHFIKSVKD